ncbi:MAG TPA: sulfotransferase [Candidatus Limnocylindria bacterium]|nr:sulfotransferase [Candidatus Limnocylindria bacterium]
MALPTFVIGGAPKAGTTALWAQLAAHPDVWMSRVKEPHFLTRDANNPAPGVHIIGAPRADTHSRGLAWYESLFDEGAERPVRGEASTHYLGALDGPELMERFVPGLKVIFVLRQPVDRAYSHYWHNLKRGHDLPPFPAVLDDDPALRYVIYMSRYRQHLERYRHALGDERLLFVLYDDLRSSPADAYRRICRFIGASEDFLPDFAREHNVHAVPVNRGLQKVLAASTYRSWSFVPAAVRRPARAIRQRLESWNLRKAAYEPMDPAVRSSLMELFRDDIAYVESVTRPLPEWWQAPERKAAGATGTAGVA